MTATLIFSLIFCILFPILVIGHKETINMEELKKSTFRGWTKAKLFKQLGLRKTPHFAPLQHWINSSSDIALTDLEQNMLAYIRQRAALHIDGWNEQHLQMNLLGPLISLVDFYILDKETKVTIARDFANEWLEGVVDNHALSGRPDLLIAMGEYSPDAPYFCFHEYKQEEAEGANDSAAQALIAMYLAQALNKSSRPIYGAYVFGRNWYFLVLQGKHYGISESYILTTNGIFEVFQILKQLKVMIAGFIEQDLLALEE